jgi:ADP-heptose:LPS heptosyltransferase
MIRICVVRIGGMGDILLTTPAVRALADHFETTAIDFVVAPFNRDAVTGLRYVRDVLPFDREADAQPGRFLAYLSRLRRARYDLFLNFQPSAKTLLMTRASGAAQKIVYRKDRSVQAETGAVMHAIDDFAKELRVLGIAVADRQMDFSVPHAAQASVADLLRAEGIGPDQRVIVVNPAGTRDINRWPPPKFAALLDRLAQNLPDVHLILGGGPNDVALSQGIAARTKTPVLNLAGRLQVKELGALLSRSALVITGDTGPLHIASAVGAPIVCLSGAADPHRTGPTRPGDLVVIHRELPCVPCGARYCRRGDIACMTQMEVDWVLDAALRRIASPLRPGVVPMRGGVAHAGGDA